MCNKNYSPYRRESNFYTHKENYPAPGSLVDSRRAAPAPAPLRSAGLGRAVNLLDRPVRRGARTGSGVRSQSQSGQPEPEAHVASGHRQPGVPACRAFRSSRKAAENAPVGAPRVPGVSFSPVALRRVRGAFSAAFRACRVSRVQRVPRIRGLRAAFRSPGSPPGSPRVRRFSWLKPIDFPRPVVYTSGHLAPVPRADRPCRRQLPVERSRHASFRVLHVVCYGRG